MGRFLESMWCVVVLTAVCFGIAVIALGCGGEGVDRSSRGFRVEGTEAGDCEDNADNDADGLFDCDDPGCAGSSICTTEGGGGTGGVGGNTGAGGTGGTSGTGGVGGNTGAGGMGGTSGTGGVGGNVGTGGMGGGRGTGGVGGMAGMGGAGGGMLCAGVDCEDGNVCTGDTCDPVDGACVHTNVADGTTCDFGGLPGVCDTGMCTRSCTTNALCSSCPTGGFCDTNADCSVGSVCIESGCESLGSAPIKHCVFGGGDACVTSDMCPPGRECIDVPGEGRRCVKTTPGCDTSFDCVPGFSCEDGSCVDRRLPCDLDDHCPKNHVCVGATNGSFCSRVQVDCMEDFDCVDLSPRCEDIDVDGKKECAGVFDPNQVPSVACVNSMCTDTSAPVCEAAGAGSATQCGQYGLCLDDADCPAGFNCVGLWPDGRKECVPGGGSCSSFADCPVRQVCASPREGGVPSCQAGFQP